MERRVYCVSERLLQVCDARGEMSGPLDALETRQRCELSPQVARAADHVGARPRCELDAPCRFYIGTTFSAGMSSNVSSSCIRHPTKQGATCDVALRRRCSARTDGTRAYRHGVIDNFSRRILAWRVADTFAPVNRVAVLLEVSRGATCSARAPVVLADAGVENVNAPVDEWVATGVLRRLLAFTELRFSTSMIEAWWRSLKHH